jgi:hypothetical protein
MKNIVEIGAKAITLTQINCNNYLYLVKYG